MLPDPAKLMFFLMASLLLVLTPGPAVVYIVARSLHQGRSAGIASALGVALGNFGQLVAAAIGVAAIVLSSAIAFSLVKYLGAAYLVYLGLRTMLARNELARNTAVPGRGLAQIFWQGFVVAILNPKVALFFIAYLPQFVDPARGLVPLQTLSLGAIFVIMGAAGDSSYAYFAGAFRKMLTADPRARRGQRLFAGVAYVGLGVITACIDAGANNLTGK